MDERPCLLCCVVCIRTIKADLSNSSGLFCSFVPGSFVKAQQLNNALSNHLQHHASAPWLTDYYRLFQFL